jgi:hypothetical protein
MFARAVTGRRLTPLLAAALVALAGCGQQRQDAKEPSGSYRVDVTAASFPASQHIATQATMRISVRNPDKDTVPAVAVTVETQGNHPGAGVLAFAQSQTDPRLADPNRPVWVIDGQPQGSQTADANTWTLGPLAPGQTKTFEWKLTPVTAGTYSVAYRISPGLTGKAELADDSSRASGAFHVAVSDKPIPARVDDNGNVRRGEQASAGND